MRNTIVIVDDASEVLRVAEVTLRRGGGYTVFSADSAASGLALIREHQPQLVLLDVMMPHMSGPELLVQMHADAALRDIPVLFMSAINPEQVAALESQGAVGVIAKPFRPTQLLDCVRRHLSGGAIKYD